MEGFDGRGDENELSRDNSMSAARSGLLPNDAIDSLTTELVTRLARRIPTAPVAEPSFLEPADPSEIDAFCKTLISSDAMEARMFFDRLRERQITPDRLCLTYIAGAARRLGDDWNSDRVGFLEVTLGSARLHGLLRMLHSDFTPRAMRYQPELSILMAAVPGETHVLGVMMAADFFRRVGWQVDLQCAATAERLCELAASGQYSMIGLSAGCESVYDNLENLVPRLRRSSPSAKLVLAGNLVAMEPDIIEQLGADGSAMDVTMAASSLQSLVAPEINR